KPHSIRVSSSWMVMAPVSSVAVTGTPLANVSSGNMSPRGTFEPDCFPRGAKHNDGRSAMARLIHHIYGQSKEPCSTQTMSRLAFQHPRRCKAVHPVRRSHRLRPTTLHFGLLLGNGTAVWKSRASSRQLTASAQTSNQQF